jgi:carboxylate-amine ligase
MVLDPDTLELTDRAAEVAETLSGDRRFKLELPASQLEIVTPPATTVGAAANALRDARHALVAAVNGTVRFAAAGAHPHSPAVGALNSGPRYDPIVEKYGWVARRQLVSAFQVHVSLGSADRTLAVYNAARSYLPLLAALAANAPFYEGVDTGLASVRPKLAELLPRQGIPPRIDSWSSYLETLAWGASSQAFPDPATWWWELRLHPGFGTLEFRVPDAQSEVRDAAAIAAVVHALAAWLGARHDADDLAEPDPTWRIDENRWSACRDGVQGEMADLRTGERLPTRVRLEQLFDALHATAIALGCEAELARARELAAVNGAMAQRRDAADHGVTHVTRWLSERFLDPGGG